MTNDNFIHRNPVWDKDVDAIVYARVMNEFWSDTYEYEELPAKKMGGDMFMVCCIPLLVEGINLGDIVSTKDGRIFSSVTKKSEYCGFRVALSKHGPEGPEVYEKLLLDLDQIFDGRICIEFNSHTFFGLALGNMKDAQQLADYLQLKETSTEILGYETND